MTLLSRFADPNNILRYLVQVMRSCWDIEPRDRPTFRRLVASLESFRNEYDEEEDIFAK